MSERTPSRTIATRVSALVGLGMLAPLAVMAWAGWVAFGELDRRALAEEELVASLTARRLDTQLGAELRALQDLGGRLEVPGGPLAAVHELRAHQREFFDEHFVLGRAGAVLAREPAAGAPLDGPGLVAEARQAGRPFLSDARSDVGGDSRVLALVPVFDRQGQLAHVIGSRAAAGSARLTRLMATPGLGPAQSVDLVDSRGAVVASSDTTRVGLRTPHSERLAAFIVQRRGGGGTCEDCAVGQQRQELYAFAPLGTVPWGVVARQPAEQAWAFAGALVRNVTLLAASLFSLALLFAWGAALSVTRPLSTLTHAAERISRGELETPIPPLPGDEVGRLGASLEVMRRSLSASVQHIARANVELEHRVEERTAQLHTLNQELEARERARTRLLRQVLAAEDAERKRIARELHDETCQSLSALVMGLHGAAATLPPEGRARVEEASTLATRTLAEVHRLIVDLRPSVLDDLGLESALAWAADRTLTSRGLTARCEFSGLERRLPRDVESALFRIAQEAMTNIARHAGAETVLIQCARRDGRVTLDIEDDGHGFDVQALGRPDSSGRGLGLMGMRERGELIGGSLVLESTPGQGTHVSLTVPVPLDEEVSHG